MATKLSELSELQLLSLRRRLASGVHDPVLTLRGALHHDLRRRCRQAPPGRPPVVPV